MAKFYGEISVVASLNYFIEAKSEEEAKEKLFNANCPIRLIDDEDNEICEVVEQNWHLVDETVRGNVRESDLNDFWIEEDFD